MHDDGRRSTDREAPPAKRRDEYGPPPSNEEIGPGTFPVFADPPFLAWQTLHRKHDLFQRIHPSCLPVILLWDEVDDYELLP